MTTTKINPNRKSLLVITYRPTGEYVFTDIANHRIPYMSEQAMRTFHFDRFISNLRVLLAYNGGKLFNKPLHAFSAKAAKPFFLKETDFDIEYLVTLNTAKELKKAKRDYALKRGAHLLMSTAVLDRGEWNHPALKLSVDEVNSLKKEALDKWGLLD